MAKRRNQKKEKALRNQAYARKFRKKTGAGRSGRRRPMDGNRAEDDQDQGAVESTDSGAVDL